MSEWVYGIHAALAVLEQQPDDVEQLLYLEQQKGHARARRVLQLAKELGVPMRKVNARELDSVTQGGKHQGVALQRRGSAASKMFTEDMLEDLLDGLSEPPLVLVLDGLQDPHNLGACLRTADAAGVHVVIAPKDKAVGLTATARKVACGAAEHIPFIQVTNLARTLDMLKERGIWISGTSLDTDQTLYDVDFTGPSAIVVGAEGKGARRLTLEHCDFLVKLPMLGSVQSLNASVATGVCIYEALRQRLSKP